jgi:hypothetical protein
MEDTCVKRPLPDCGDSEQKGTSEGFCPDWDACMPFGGRLYSRDGCVQFEASAQFPDFPLSVMSGAFPRQWYSAAKDAAAASVAAITAIVLFIVCSLVLSFV